MKFSAHVITGSGRGKDLNVPTINLDMTDIDIPIEDGLYLCMVDGDQPGLLHYGVRPTFEDTPSCEVHILDLDITTPPKSLSVEILQKIRETQKFESAEELMSQMKEDIQTARGILGIS